MEFEQRQGSSARTSAEHFCLSHLPLSPSAFGATITTGFQSTLNLPEPRRDGPSWRAVDHTAETIKGRLDLSSVFSVLQLRSSIAITINGTIPRCSDKQDREQLEIREPGVR
jgi:hypothetical protein